MDILKLLQENPRDLYPEDLDILEVELATGGPYDDLYKSQCLELIKKIRNWNNSQTSAPDVSEQVEIPTEKSSRTVEKRLDEIAPKEVIPAMSKLTPEEAIYHDINQIRMETTYKSSFKQYVEEHEDIDSEFIDKHYSFFRPWEMDAILSVRQMPEEFLEKYFSALDHDKIAKYQQFSEMFFIRHFATMDAKIVLESGKNEWCKKENRSKQLDVFLRLKGVKI